MPTTMQDILRQQQQQRPLNQNSENSSDPSTQFLNGLRRYNEQSNGGLNRGFQNMFGGAGGSTGAMGTSYAGSGAMGTGFGLGSSLVGGGMSGAGAGGGLGGMLGSYGGYGGASMAGGGGFGAIGGTTANAGLGSVLGGGAAAGGAAGAGAGGGAAAGGAAGGGMGAALMSNPWTAIAAAIIGGANYMDNKDISSWGDTLKGKAGGNLLDYYGGRNDGKTHGFLGKLFDQDKAPGQTTKAVTDLSEGDFSNAWKNAKAGIKSIFKLDFF